MYLLLFIYFCLFFVRTRSEAFCIFALYKCLFIILLLLICPPAILAGVHYQIPLFNNAIMHGVHYLTMGFDNARVIMHACIFNFRQIWQ